ncbi:N-acetylmuramoyl-L-alanine amidase [Spirochaetia bacterium]|nr:N-acetylmuramoyl-L-alanine amidase [Spirochaetia bacterium]
MSKRIHRTYWFATYRFATYRFTQPRFSGLSFFLLFLALSPGIFPEDMAVTSTVAAASPVPAAIVAAPAPALSLEDTLKTLEAELRWDPLFRSGILSSGNHSLAFQTGTAGARNPVVLDNRDVLTLPAPYLEEGALRFPGEFVSAAKKALEYYLQQDRFRFRIAAIIIDPGHGGKDSGALGTYTVKGKAFTLAEKDVTLRVSLDLHALLRAAYPDKQILLTRTGDTYPELKDRAIFANSVPLKENEAIIYISIHANASKKSSARGYEVWYLTPETRRTLIDESKYGDSMEIGHILNDMMEEEFTTESITMAQLIIKQFKENLGDLIPSRGIKAEDWYVVKNSRMPAVLVELGFVTNQADALLMTSETHLPKFSQALYKGITAFVDKFEDSGGFTFH